MVVSPSKGFYVFGWGGGVTWDDGRKGGIKTELQNPIILGSNPCSAAS